MVWLIAIISKTLVTTRFTTAFTFCDAPKRCSQHRFKVVANPPRMPCSSWNVVVDHDLRDWRRSEDNAVKIVSTYAERFAGSFKQGVEKRQPDCLVECAGYQNANREYICFKGMAQVS
jgi:hypothetical protein